MSNIDQTIISLMQGKKLGKFTKCPTCDEYDWLGTHSCEQRWDAILFNHDDEDEPNKVYCNGDAEDAAIKFAEINFSHWEYPRNMEVWVRMNEDAWQKFDIFVESVPSFSAEEIKDNSNG